MTSKTVLHVIERFNIAGAEIVVRDLLNLFEGSDWKLHVCVLQDKGVLGTEMFNRGFPIHYINWKNDGLNDLEIISKLRKIINEVQPDIIHAHNLVPWYFATFSSFGKKKIRRCVTLHGFLTGTGVWKKKVLYSLLSHFTQKIAIVSPMINTQLQTIPIFAKGKVEVVPNGINTDEIPGFNSQMKRKELGLKQDDFVIGSVARISPEKNFEMQIRLIARLRNRYPQIKLVIVTGKGDFFKVLEDLAISLGVEKNVVFTGLRRDVPEILRTFDLFVMSSFSEGTSLALLEAMAAGLPVVVSEVGGNGEIINHGQNGMLFDVNSLDIFENMVADLIADSDRRNKLAEEARKTAESYSFASMKSRYISFYNVFCSKNM